MTQGKRGHSVAQARNATPTPFVKWAGGKTQLLAQYQAHMPHEVQGQYIEPFVGGGALFFWLTKQGALKDTVVLNDLNKELMNCYVAIRDDVQAVIEALREHEKHRLNKDHFYRVRNWDRDPGFHSHHDEVERAARTIYLNHTCYNGLYRVNSRGQFNVPFGKYDNPRVLDVENLRAVSQALQSVELTNQDFAMVLDWAKPGDFVYFDPPYQPLSETSNFTSYTKESFDLWDQERLADVFRALAKRGCRVALSNSHSDTIRQLYDGFRQEIVQATRAISSQGDGRGAIPELLILSY